MSRWPSWNGAFTATFRRVQDAVTPLPHAREFLLFCRKRGLRTFVLSTVHQDYFALQAAASGFDKLIDRALHGNLGQAPQDR
jgi:hypothetical protein